MDTLPTEILGVILRWEVLLCSCEKNKVMPLRLVCKAFDAALRPFVLKCVQLEFSRLRRDAPPLDVEALNRIGNLCSSLYLDLMVVRDEEELQRLSEIFHGVIPKVPDIGPLLESLRKYCMNETTFDETDYRRLAELTLVNTPNLTRLKLNLPYQVVGQQSRTATLIFATTMASIRARPEEFKSLEYLVLDHVTDTTLIDICNNHIDLGNTLSAFKGLKHLILSIRRQESRHNRQTSFAQHLWFLIAKATDLRSLCLIGWNVRRSINTRVHAPGVQQQVWDMRSLPFMGESLCQKLLALEHLELKRVDIIPEALLNLIKQVSTSLKELYLNEVYLKVRSAEALVGNTSLWIGYPGIPRPQNCCWLAEDLYNLETLKLDILRVTGIGYDDFVRRPRGATPEYDLKDPSDRDRSFDERFVNAVMKGPDPIIMQAMNNMNNMTNNPPIWPPIVSSSMDSSPTTSRPTSSSSTVAELSSSVSSAPAPVHPPRIQRLLQHYKMKEYDAEIFQRYHNTTSFFKRCIDDHFLNHNEQALKELGNIITVADRGMTILTAEANRAREQHRVVWGAPILPAIGATAVAGTDP